MLSLSDRRQKRRSTDPLLPRKDHGDGAVGVGASYSSAVFNLSTTVVGAGVMALPATLKQLGMIPGLIAIVGGAMITEASIDMMLRFSYPSKARSYSGLVADAFGSAGRSLLQACIVINNLGLLVVYLIIIGDVVSGTRNMNGVHHSGVVEGWVGETGWLADRFILLLITTLFVLAPLISLKRVDSLRYTSALSVGLAIVFVVIIAALAIIKLIQGTIDMPRFFPTLVDQSSFWNLFTCVPVLVTAYICHHNVHPIANELREPTRMKSIVRSSLGLCLCVYLATSFFGFLLFGDQTQEDVLANFDANLGVSYSSLLDDVVRVSYCAHLMLVFPIVFFSLRLNLDGLLFPYAAVPIASDKRRFFAVTLALMGFIFLGANLVPTIWDAFQFTGATTAVAVGFIFPAAIALRDIHGIATKKDRLISWVMIVLAISSSTIAIFSDVYSIFRHTNGSLAEEFKVDLIRDFNIS